MVASRHGFTLIELSIVLVIIGLIAGGILVGQQLIEGAKVQSIIADVEKLKTSVQTFRLKYNCLPGDCTNATSLFSGVTGVTNGNGDRIYNGWAESYSARYMLIASKLWEGDRYASAGQHYFLRISGVSDADITQAGAILVTNDPYAGISIPLNGIGGNVISITGWCGYEYRAGVLSTDTAYSLDRKVDDGLPTSGRVGGRAAAELTGYIYDPCSNHSSLTYYSCLNGSAYDHQNKANKCRMLFLW